MTRQPLDRLLDEVRACRICEPHLADGVRPVLQVSEHSRILIAGQAPGRRVHETGVPFDDPSGERLRDWMGVSRNTFYAPDRIAILPMGFCFPGSAKSGDRAPRPECAEAWRASLLAQLKAVRLTLIIGQYAMRWHLPEARGGVTQTVRDWRACGPDRIPLPHPSPRNNIWLRKNPWFAAEVLPHLRRQVERALHPAS